MGRLDDKVALITGAGSGIGRAVALLFAEEGAKIAVADYVPDAGEETVGMIKKNKGAAIFIQADVSQSSDVKRMIKATVDTYGRIDILHNNAGINSPVVSIVDLTEEQWNQVIDTDLKSVFLGTKFIIPVMLKQGGGVIINTSSVMGQDAEIYMMPYCVAKAGVIMLTKATSVEYFKQGIRANCICPGFITTAMTDPWAPVIDVEKMACGVWGKPEDIAQAALYLACGDSAYVSGAALVVDGGYSAECIVPLK
jgi:NAD(P)-dependent dehydrogenase (short-subunit alcohol dehydrogenase family)